MKRCIRLLRRNLCVCHICMLSVFVWRWRKEKKTKNRFVLRFSSPPLPLLFIVPGCGSHGPEKQASRVFHRNSVMHGKVRNCVTSSVPPYRKFSKGDLFFVFLSLLHVYFAAVFITAARNFFTFVTAVLCLKEPNLFPLKCCSQCIWRFNRTVVIYFHLCDFLLQQ